MSGSPAGTWRPLAHFVVLGLALFALTQLGGAQDPAPQPPIPPASLDADQATRWVEESLLVEAALAHGLDRDDPVVRRRLVDNLRFAGQSGDDADLLAMAARLDMARHDPVVRRRLATRVQALRPATARVDEGDLASWYAKHRARFRTPEQRTFRLVRVPTPATTASQPGPAPISD